jgi:CelD/BcsL family acetyltransferase involved in cellulose biosynthesis
VQPRRFLENIWRECLAAGLGFVVIARWRSRAIATGLFLGWNGTLIYKFGASDPDHWHRRPNNLVFGTAIRTGIDQGYRWLDLGRSESDNHGLREFKRRWGALEVPLIYSHVSDDPPSRMTAMAPAALTHLIQKSPPIVCRAIGELLYRRAAYQ